MSYLAEMFGDSSDLETTALRIQDNNVTTYIAGMGAEAPELPGQTCGMDNTAKLSL